MQWRPSPTAVHPAAAAAVLRWERLAEPHLRVGSRHRRGGAVLRDVVSRAPSTDAAESAAAARLLLLEVVRKMRRKVLLGLLLLRHAKVLLQRRALLLLLRWLRGV